MLTDKGYGADWFRASTTAASSPAYPRGPTDVCRLAMIRRFAGPAQIENTFGRIKDWRRIHTRYDLRAHTIMSAISIATTVICRL